MKAKALAQPGTKYRRWQHAARVAVYQDQLAEAGVWPWQKHENDLKATMPEDQWEIARLMTGIWAPARIGELLAGPQFLGMAQWLRDLWPQERIDSMVYWDNPLLNFFGVDRNAEPARMVGLSSYVSREPPFLLVNQRDYSALRELLERSDKK